MDRYEEALERAKAGKPLEEVFPELKESDDERIRRGLLRCLDDIEDGWIVLHGISKNDAIAYLEKQKKQKAGRVKLKYTINSNDSRDEQLRKIIISLLGSELFQVTGGKFTKQELIDWVKQKPTDIAPNQFDGITYGMSGYSTDHSAEWSEEDEKYLNIAINIVASDFGEDSPTVSWLKSLHPQPHWKPSEEQIGALNYAYCELFKRGDVKHNILGSLQNLIDTLRNV